MLDGQAVVDAAVGDARIVAGGLRQASVSSCASTSVISLTFSVKPSRYSPKYPTQGVPLWVVPSFSFTSNSPLLGRVDERG